MEEIIKKSIEAGVFGNPEKMAKINWFIGKGNEADLLFFDNGIAGITVSLHKQFMSKDFWQALGKACGWKKKEDFMKSHETVFMVGNNRVDEWRHNAMKFHEINITECFDKAIEYLKSITN